MGRDAHLRPEQPDPATLQVPMPEGDDVGQNDDEPEGGTPHDCIGHTVLGNVVRVNSILE